MTGMPWVLILGLPMQWHIILIILIALLLKMVFNRYISFNFQCYSASHSLDFGSIDLLIVSPHQRALETCANLIKFSNQKYQKTVIVEPLLAGSLWSSCDISKSLNQKIREFSSFNFSRMVNHSDLWFLQNLSQIDRLKIQG